MKHSTLFIPITITLLVLDQLLKYLAIKNILPDLGGYLAYVCNPNISWGIPLGGFWFWILWIIIMLILAYLLAQSFNFGLLLILAGAISNAIDRLIHGCVIDYINLGFFPIFNLADAMITVGVV